MADRDEKKMPKITMINCSVEGAGRNALYLNSEVKKMAERDEKKVPDMPELTIIGGEYSGSGGDGLHLIGEVKAAVHGAKLEGNYNNVYARLTGNGKLLLEHNTNINAVLHGVNYSTYQRAIDKIQHGLLEQIEELDKNERQLILDKLNELKENKDASSIKGVIDSLWQGVKSVSAQAIVTVIANQMGEFLSNGIGI